MENIILFDDKSYKDLYPLTYTRPIAEIRVGALTIREKWELWFNNPASYLTADHLTKKYPLVVKSRNLIINGGVLPSPSLCEEIIELNEGEVILDGESLLVAKFSDEEFKILKTEQSIGGFISHQTKAEYIKINYPWEIFSQNGAAIRSDYDKLTRNRLSEALPESNQLIGPRNQLFIEPGASVEGAILNTNTGPIYIGKDASVMEGAIIRGPFALGHNGVVKLGAKVYGPTTVGPYAKIGGEVNNSVLFGYCNKGHDGFLGNSVIGEWCNLGADTNNSNLKNNYAEVRVWNYKLEGFVSTGLQFCGLIMGDHSKCGINTMFNTGTVVGVSANIFGAGFPRNFVPSFTWGGPSGMSTYRVKKAFETAERVMIRRQKELDKVERDILEHVFRISSTYRRWEKG